MSGEATTAEKLRFATEWLRLGDHLKAGHAAFPDDAARACLLADQLKDDEETLALRDEVLAERGGKAAFLPDKDDLARKALELAEEKKGDDYSHSAYSRLNAFRLYAELRGFILPRGSKTDESDENKPPVDFVEQIAALLPS